MLGSSMCRPITPTRLAASLPCCQIRHECEGTLREHQRGRRRAHAVNHLRPFPFSCADFVVARSRACPRFPLHGKEGVDGSSPSEGLHNVPANCVFRCLFVEHEDTFGHILVSATQRDVWRRFATRFHRERQAASERKAPAQEHFSFLSHRKPDPLRAERESGRSLRLSGKRIERCEQSAWVRLPNQTCRS